MLFSLSVSTVWHMREYYTFFKIFSFFFYLVEITHKWVSYFSNLFFKQNCFLSLLKVWERKKKIAATLLASIFCRNLAITYGYHATIFYVRSNIERGIVREMKRLYHRWKHLGCNYLHQSPFRFTQTDSGLRCCGRNGFLPRRSRIRYSSLTYFHSSSTTGFPLAAIRKSTIFRAGFDTRVTAGSLSLFLSRWSYAMIDRSDPCTRYIWFTLKWSITWYSKVLFR